MQLRQLSHCNLSFILPKCENSIFFQISTVDSKLAALTEKIFDQNISALQLENTMKDRLSNFTQGTRRRLFVSFVALKVISKV